MKRRTNDFSALTHVHLTLFVESSVDPEFLAERMELAAMLHAAAEKAIADPTTYHVVALLCGWDGDQPHSPREASKELHISLREVRRRWRAAEKLLTSYAAKHTLTIERKPAIPIRPNRRVA